MYFTSMCTMSLQIDFGGLTEEDNGTKDASEVVELIGVRIVMKST